MIAALFLAVPISVAVIGLYVWGKDARDYVASRAIPTRENHPRVFVRAIKPIKGDGLYEFDIVGESRYQENLLAIAGPKQKSGADFYTKAFLIPDNLNKHDDQAIKVEIESLTVGYFSREDARTYRRRLKARGFPIEIYEASAVIVGGWKNNRSEGHFGVRLDLAI